MYFRGDDTDADVAAAVDDDVKSIETAAAKCGWNFCTGVWVQMQCDRLL